MSAVTGAVTSAVRWFPVRVDVESGKFHLLRLEAGPGNRSRSAWIYVNRPGAK